jgi:hypothetical protein
LEHVADMVGGLRHVASSHGTMVRNTQRPNDGARHNGDGGRSPLAWPPPMASFAGDSSRAVLPDVRRRPRHWTITLRLLGLDHAPADATVAHQADTFAALIDASSSNASS